MLHSVAPCKTSAQLIHSSHTQDQAPSMPHYLLTFLMTSTL